MSQTGSPRPSTLSIESLLALNREIAALVRAGVPLEEGLLAAAEGLDRPSAQLFQRLSARMAAGETLQAALAAERGTLPQVYSAVVESGLRAGRLPQTLESLTALAESLLAVRRRMRLAFIYPVIVTILAYLFFVGFVARGVPVVVDLQKDVHLSLGPMARILDSLHSTVGLWGPLIPVIVIVIALGLMTAHWLRGGGNPLRGGWMFELPGLSRIRSNLVRGQFCQMLSVLLENRTPLPEALRLASRSLGDVRLENDAERLAVRLERGESLTDGWQASPVFSPLLQWMMSAGAVMGQLPNVLRQAGELSLRQARWQLEWFKRVSPVIVLTCVGGGVVVFYGLATFLPLVEMLERLAIEPFL